MCVCVCMRAFLRTSIYVYVCVCVRVCLHVRTTLTRGHLVVVRSGPVSEHVLHLEELVMAVAPNDGEAKPLGALPQICPQNGALEMGWVPYETPHTHNRLI